MTRAGFSSEDIGFLPVSAGRKLSVPIRVHPWLSLIRLVFTIFLAITATTHAQDDGFDPTA